LTPLEEAAAFQQLIEDFGLTHEQVSSRVGKSRSAVTNTLRLMTLPPTIQHLLADGRLSAGHARALLGSPDRAFQEHLAKRAVTEGLSVRSVEEAIRARVGPQESRPSDVTDGTLHDGQHDGAGLTPITRLRPPGLLELEHLLAEHLGTKVAVSMGAKRGRITIDFADLEDLERIYRSMVEGSGDSIA
jgi:ParB family chromosome partitioning protein